MEWLTDIGLDSQVVIHWQVLFDPIAQHGRIAKGIVQSWRDALDPFIWLVGSLLALIPGSFAAYRWWFYSKYRLPLRLEELLNQQAVQVKEARDALLSAIEVPNAARVRVTPPLFTVPALQHSIRNLSWGGWSSPFLFSSAESEMNDALGELNQKLVFCEKRRRDCITQQATAYLVKGAIAAARATRLGNDTSEAARENRNALDYFLRAFSLNESDLEALQYVAHQHRVLKEDDLAFNAFERLAEKTVNGDSETKLMNSRANRYMAEICEKQFEETRISVRLKEAGTYLDAALESLPDVAKGQIDSAAIYEVFGRVKEKEGARKKPAEYYSKALSIYSELKNRDPSDSEAAAGFDRVDQRLREFLARQAAAQAQSATVSP